MFVDLIKRTLWLWEKTSWIKTLNKEARKLEKYRNKITIQSQICEELYKEYEERFVKRSDNNAE